MKPTSDSDANGSGKGAFALFAGSMAFAFVNYGRLLLWAFPLPLFGVVSAYLLDGTGVGGMDLLDAPGGQPESGDGEASAIDDGLFAADHGDSHVLSLARGLVGMLLAVPVQFAVQRNLLVGSPLLRPTYATLFTSRLVWRYVALMLALSFLVWVLAFLHSSLAARLLSGDPEQTSAGLVALSYALLTAALLVVMKLSPAPALLAKGDPHPIRASWRATQGGLLRLFGLYLLCVLALSFATMMTITALGGLAQEGVVVPLLVAVEAVSFLWVVALAAAPALYLKARLPGDASPGQKDAKDAKDASDP